MKKIVLITGANGLLAKQLSKKLEEDFILRFLTRNVQLKNEFLWDVDKKYIDPEAFVNVNHIIHLAGTSIASESWTPNRKKMIYSSRVDSAQLLLEELKKNKQVIETYISASAIGYYGTYTSDAILSEESPNGNDFLSEVCYDWEKIAHSFITQKIAKRMSILRMGVIFTYNGGALKKMLQPIKFGMGSGIGSGKQWMPWIHISDLSNIFKFILDNKEVNGIYNAVSPEYSTNIEVTKKIAKMINRKIFLPNIPKFIMKLLFGEMSVILLEGSRVSSDKIIESGYEFEYPNLEYALNDILKSSTE